MTKYIEEMMKTAGLSNCRYCDYKMEECGCFYCEDVKYPDFTPKKQLEVIKLITQLGFLATLNVIILQKKIDFIQALAQLTNKLIKTGVLDKEKVKEILEG